MYDSLEKQMKILIENLAPTTNYCKTCTITGKNNDGTVDVIADFGQQGKLTHRICIGNPNIGDLGVLIPLNDDWNNSIVISKTSLTSTDFEDILSIKETVVEYGLSSSATEQPEEWSKEIPEILTGKYLWTKTTLIYTNGETQTSYTISYQGTDGTDGEGVRYIYCRSKTQDATLPPLPKLTDTIPEEQSDDPDNQIWVDNPAGVIGTLPYEWVSTSEKIGDHWSSYSTPVLWAVYSFDGEDGKQGIQGDKGDAGEDGKDGTTLPQEILDKLADGRINADFLEGHTSDDFILSEVEEYKVTVYSQAGSGDVIARRQGNVVTVNIMGVGLTTSSDGKPKVFPNVNLPDSMVPDFDEPIYEYGYYKSYGTFEGGCTVCIEPNGVIKLVDGPGISRFVEVYVNFTYIKNPVKGNSRFLTATDGEVQDNISLETGSPLIFKIQGTGSPNSTSYSNLVGATIIFKIDGVEYPRVADENGLVKLDITLKPGNYTNCTISFKGDDLNKSITRTFTLNVSKLVNVSFTSFSDGTISIRSGEGVPLTGEQYQLQILGVTSTGVLGSSSDVKLQLNKYRGEFTVKVTLLASNKIASNHTQTFTFTGTSTGNNVERIILRPGSVAQISCSRCKEYSTLSKQLVSYRDEQYARTYNLSSASGTYHTPSGLRFTGYDFSSIPAHATINKITVTVVYGHFGYTAVSNAGSFDAPTLRLVTSEGNKGPQNCTSLTSSNWNKWVSSSLVFNNISRSSLNSNFKIEFVPKQNKSGNTPYFAFDYVELAVEYKY